MITNPFGRNRRRAEERRRAVVAGGAVTVACRLRRTSPRGWGPWTPGRLELGPVPDGGAVWHVDDPIAVGLPAVHGPVDASFPPGADVWLRPVRFQTEGFWGMDAQIVVVEDERATIELAIEPPIPEDVAARLAALLAPSA
ncbi:MAG: hypothetical protein KA758_09310 [Acidimicrobiales bacterium]|nr:hypothetical protein [Acidimicrobiales bacterium]